MIKILKIEPKEEPRDEIEDSTTSRETATEFQRQNLAPTDELFAEFNAGKVELSDILELSEKELAKRIYEAETGIKYLYFVLLRKTEKMRFLAKARKLKSIFVEQNPTSKGGKKEGMRGPRRKSLTNFDPSCADYRALHRILMSDEERAEMYQKRRQQQRERQKKMTEEERAEQRAKARRKTMEKWAQMDAGQREAARRKRAEWKRKYRENAKKKKGSESTDGNGTE